MLKGATATPITHRGVTLTVRRCKRIERLIDSEPTITRMELSKRVCEMFRWQRPNGELAERSCRSLLQRLDDRGCIRLPARRRPARARRCASSQHSSAQLPVEPWPEDVPRRDPCAALLVRPILPQERGVFRSFLQHYHYLGFRPLVGESLCYAAFWEGELVALSAWAAASLKNRPRDDFIGWQEPTKHKRLPFVVNNVRFVLLPTACAIENLASRVLAATLRHLSRDWQSFYHHPLYLAETFVDEARFRGTCYHAANWVRLGLTQGFGRHGPHYRHHGQPKAVWIYPLRPDAVERLRDESPPWTSSQEPAQMTACDLDVERLPLSGEDGLIDLLQRIPELRCARGRRHPLVTILALAVLALLRGYTSFEAIAQFARGLSPDLRKRLGARRSDPPSEPTFRRVLSRLPADKVDALVTDWLARQCSRLDVGIALDGKTLRGSRDGETPPVHLLSALLHRKGIVVAQQRVPDKTNEIPCVATLLQDLPIEGAMVTADALHTQQDTARFLVEQKKADYLFIAKDNQPTLRQDIELLDLRSFPPSAPNG
jgi:hypothetical protein